LLSVRRHPRAFSVPTMRGYRTAKRWNRVRNIHLVHMPADCAAGALSPLSVSCNKSHLVEAVLLDHWRLRSWRQVQPKGQPRQGHRPHLSVCVFSPLSPVRMPIPLRCAYGPSVYSPGADCRALICSADNGRGDLSCRLRKLGGRSHPLSNLLCMRPAFCIFI
jgi:hypothetical protein